MPTNGSGGGGGARTVAGATATAEFSFFGVDFAATAECVSIFCFFVAFCRLSASPDDSSSSSSSLLLLLLLLPPSLLLLLRDSAVDDSSSITSLTEDAREDLRGNSFVAELRGFCAVVFAADAVTEETDAGGGGGGGGSAAAVAVAVAAGAFCTALNALVSFANSSRFVPVIITRNFIEK